MDASYVAVSQRLHGIIPVLGMGTVVRDGRQLRELPSTVATFLEVGGHLIDTAPTYGSGKAQSRIGVTLAQWPRSHLWLTSKIPVASMGFEATLRQVNKTLRDLHTPYVDLMLVHRPTNAPGPKGANQQRVTRALRLATYRALLHAQSAGLIRHVGVSNHGIIYLRELAEAGLAAPVVNEIEFHPWIDEQQWQLVRYCRSRGIHLIAYNSLGGLGASHAAPQVTKLAQRHKRGEAQILLRWAVDHGATVIPYASSRTHIQQNLAVADFSLTADELTSISQESRPAKWSTFEFNDPHHVDAGSLGCESATELIARHERAFQNLERASANSSLELLGIRTYVVDAHTWPSAGLCSEAMADSHGAAARTLAGFVERSRRPFVILPRYFAHEQSAVGQLRELLHEQHSHLYNQSCNNSVKCSKGTAYGVGIKKEACHRCHDGAVPADGHNLNSRWVPAGGDMRCHACDGFSEFCTLFKRDALVNELAAQHYQQGGRNGTRPEANVLANALGGAVGVHSGGEFHQDEQPGDCLKSAGDVSAPQMKCMTYLEDVRGGNGPFTMLIGYDKERMQRKHVFAQQIKSIWGRARYVRASYNALARTDAYRRHRFNFEAITEETQRSAFVVELHAPAGTVICFDSGSIHHGKELQHATSRRAASTLYLLETIVVGNRTSCGS